MEVGFVHIHTKGDRQECMYSVFQVIVLQEQGGCELVLGLIVSQKASMVPQDWAEISFRSETL